MTAQQLKNSILQMAVQGKLVPQDPNDEPASVLLERIRKEKEQLIKEGKIKREKNPSVIFRGADNTPYEKVGDEEHSLTDEIPFDIPDSWEWARLKSFCVDIFSGKSPKYEKEATEFRIIGQAANQQSGLDYSQIKYTNKDFWDSMDDRYFLRENDVILNTLGNGTLGRSGIIEKLDYPLLTDGHLFVFRTILPVSSWYLYLYLQHRKEEIEKAANGSTNQTFLSLSNTIDWIIPVPPLSEQKRIVDRYRSTLSGLESYNAAYLRIEELNTSFPDMLKKSILQMAVQGKLVPQDPNDEPASVLLERIRAEKDKLIAAGKIKRDKSESVIFRRDNSHYEKLGSEELCIDDEIPFEIPDSWEWVRLGEIVSKEIKRGKSPKYAVNGKTLVFAQKCNVKAGGIDLTLAKYLDDSTFNSYPVDEYMISDDIVVNSTGNGTLGRVGYFQETDRIGNGEVVPDSHVTIVRVLSSIEPRYIYIVLKYYQPILEKQGEGSTNQTELKPAAISSLIVPIPPRTEQQRIVNALDNALEMIKQL